MNTSGKNILGFNFSSQGETVFFAKNPATGYKLETAYHEAIPKEIDEAITLAENAFTLYREKTGEEKALFLETIAEELFQIEEGLVGLCAQETGLPDGRLKGELGRTTGQLKLFATVLRNGSWVDARVDTADSNRKPFPKPDIRQMQIALGPVGVFGASNFPLAFSVAGGDTASALAAGCTVVVKAHPAHPGTSELVGKAIIAAAKRCNMPDGVFSLVQGASIAVGQAIVRNPLIKAIGFTGSFRGGKALFDEAAKREEPIPVYAEMGSVNPVFVLPGILKKNHQTLAEGLSNSVQLGAGQFCTNPGITVLPKLTESNLFEDTLKNSVAVSESSTMLTESIQDAYNRNLEKLKTKREVASISIGKKADGQAQGVAEILSVSANHFLKDKEMEEEVFGPSTLLVRTEDKSEIMDVAKSLNGHLTATVHGTQEDLEEYADLLKILERKVGRLLLNGFPTGVEVCHSMVHGGPFPATTDARMTSVGTAAITRFTRPICFQNYPDSLLPDELKAENPLNILRIENGNYVLP
ncbi:aldehyde dehydrogenase (NADP(+)) [Flagellimonas aquimarina]|jgi:alpha-ketoglutaric semialdehyde dehydrogenase|uniref:Aldehyde dehydrogenase (NADP(+)) n=1 Tax=Flagellimonas aquimarina TaxID=2201895 RepID=A0A316KUC8_9FLAO|nr:aldehyde dehydrogenase (NADP(+)) [Allomuricauda koreensis]PWL37797.1 aldehyde dehydrogenase (NADP(+)) [Allomuricauda koreensis]